MCFSLYVDLLPATASLFKDQHGYFEAVLRPYSSDVITDFFVIVRNGKKIKRNNRERKKIMSKQYAYKFIEINIAKADVVIGLVVLSLKKPATDTR